MLFGQTTKLPIYQLNYSGSLNDTSTLEHTIKKFQALFGISNDTFIMDKAFYSQKNLNLFLIKKTKFLVSVPFTNSFAKDQVRSEQKDIDTLQNLILTT
jgi:transposase